MKSNLKTSDPQIHKYIRLEEKRQREVLEMIPSENYVSAGVLEATGSVLTNKYSEGLADHRYYEGNKYIDEIEKLAIERAKKLYNVPHVNVQPYSGSPMNTAVMFALLNPGDRIAGMRLNAGGHLTHGHPKVTFSGKYFQSFQFGVNEEGWLDYDAIEALVREHKPKLIIAGTTAYPRILNWKKLSDIAKKVDAYLVADVSHINGLIVAGVHPDPVPYVHVVTSTTHKTLRGPRGAIILVTKKGLSRDADMGKKIDSAVFPGLQGGPHNNTTAAIAVALKEASSAKFKKYGEQIVKNAKKLAGELNRNGITLVTGGTDNHLCVLDLRPFKTVGNIGSYALNCAGIVTNYNTVPFDPNPPMYPSGIRLGTPAITSRGMKEREMVKIARWIALVLESVKNIELPSDKTKRRKFVNEWKSKIDKDKRYKQIYTQVVKLTRKFPAPGL